MEKRQVDLACVSSDDVVDGSSEFCHWLPYGANEGLAEALGESEADGDCEADGLREAEGLCDALGDCEDEADALGEREADGETEADGLEEADGEIDRDREAEGETDGEIEAEVLIRSPGTLETTAALALSGRHKQINRIEPPVMAAAAIFTLMSSVTIFSAKDVAPDTASTVESGVASCQISLIAKPVALATWAIIPAVLVVVPTSMVGVPPLVIVDDTTAINLTATTPVTLNRVYEPIAPWLPAKLKLFSVWIPTPAMISFCWPSVVRVFMLFIYSFVLRVPHLDRKNQQLFLSWTFYGTQITSYACRAQTPLILWML